jgi:hypothetical protein
VDTARSPTNVRVVPDLRDGLLLAIDRLEALLFADGKALGALQTMRDVVRPTQGRDEPRQRSAVTAHPGRVMPKESGRVTIARSAFERRGVELTSPAQEPEGSHGG